jgi:hypothetical protein
MGHPPTTPDERDDWPESGSERDVVSTRSTTRVDATTVCVCVNHNAGYFSREACYER